MFQILWYNTLIMKSTIKKKTYRAIYRLLDRVSPLEGDCGALCGAACCCPEPTNLMNSAEDRPNQPDSISESASPAALGTPASEMLARDAKQETDEQDAEMGIYLLPGEEKLFTRKEDWLEWTVEDAEDFDFPDSWIGKIYFVRCNCAPGCPRELRPLQCRFFPVSPHLFEDGRLALILSDLELPYACPLIRDRMELTPSFLKATYTVWTHLIRDPLLLDLVVFDSGFRNDEEVIQVYP